MARPFIKLETVFNRIPAVSAGMDDAMDLVLAKGATDISAGAISYIDDHGIIDTGNLKATQGSGPAPEGGWMAYSGADYSTEVHEGTGSVAGRPFLLEPYLLIKPDILDAARQAIEILAGGG